MYSKILVAYDDSEGSQAALAHAADIATFHRATLILTHVEKEKRSSSSQSMIPAGGYSGVSTVNGVEQEPDTENNRSAFLLKKARNNLAFPDSQIETEMLHGEQPAKEICDFASMNEVDLIVMGNRGLHGFQKIMLGSVSQKVAQNAHCPVLIVK